jgi:hypothetical protein
MHNDKIERVDFAKSTNVPAPRRVVTENLAAKLNNLSASAQSVANSELT